MANRGNDPRTPSGIPPPPKLSFPTIYNGQKKQPKDKLQKKPLSPAAVQWYDPVTGRLPRDIHNFVLDINDFRTLSREDRRSLLEGSVVKLTIDNELVAEVPLRLLLAASQEARQLYLSMPPQPFVQMNIGNQIYKDALKLLAAWMKDACTKVKAYFISPRGSFAQDVNLIAAAASLGMDNCVAHIMKIHWAALKRNPITLPQLITIDRAAPSPDFSLLDCVVGTLANQLVHDELSTDDPEFLDWMERCPRIAIVLYQRYTLLASEQLKKHEAKEAKKHRAEEMAELRAVGKKAKQALDEQHKLGKKQKDDDKKERERAKAGREERRMEKELREQLQQRLNSGRITTVTAEQARLLPRRGSEI
ncbi:hypothetical protein K458DRAFT_402576 [Lentithecium fluviatile CBS 122367]|uniref:Uncharacterized protein n=1 Tax=Lentithecium fluviatile CBS 122367 TaxID=1168545 RepID=A0A6G1J728_9PLEO|nr:hypothetical protein K458DRAFT_402576 [Lentithecium fluviatile CBS 122367]